MTQTWTWQAGAPRREQSLETLTQNHFCSIARYTKADMLFQLSPKGSLPTNTDFRSWVFLRRLCLEG